MKQFIKQTISFLLCMTMCFAFCACGLTKDSVAPQILGLSPINIEEGDNISFREGVSATDDVDGVIDFEVDAEDVNLNAAGQYKVIYTAKDKAGNITTETRLITVSEKSEASIEDTEAGDKLNEPGIDFDSLVVTDSMLAEYVDRIIADIIKPGSDMQQQAMEIQRYVYFAVKYVSPAELYDWKKAAYLGFYLGKGDCYTYYCCSRALLEAANIPNVPMVRVGGRTDHYWNAVNTGDGWYHFDACPMPTGYSIYGYRIDEKTAREHTKKLADADVRTNYFTYDYKNMPTYNGEVVRIVGWEEFAEDYLDGQELEEFRLVHPKEITEPDTETDTEPTVETDTELNTESVTGPDAEYSSR